MGHLVLNQAAVALGAVDCVPEEDDADRGQHCNEYGEVSQERRDRVNLDAGEQELSERPYRMGDRQERRG